MTEAALVRRNGIQSIGITTATTGRRERLAQALLHARCYDLPDNAERGHLPKLLEPFTVSQVFLTAPITAGLPDRLYDSLAADFVVTAARKTPDAPHPPNTSA